VSNGFTQQLDEALAQYQRRRTELAEFQRNAAEVSATVTAPRKVVSVTIGNAGVVKEIKFPTSAFKNLSGPELAKVLERTIEDARALALDKVADLLAPMLPAGLDPRQVVRGTADLATVMPEDPVDLTGEPTPSVR
jgi:DNA-binding protein YbaB